MYVDPTTVTSAATMVEYKRDGRNQVLTRRRRKEEVIMSLHWRPKDFTTASFVASKLYLASYVARNS